MSFFPHPFILSLFIKIEHTVDPAESNASQKLSCVLLLQYMY